MNVSNGDKVVCIWNEGVEHLLTLTKEYTVVDSYWAMVPDLDFKGPAITVMCDDGNISTFDAKAFVAAAKPVIDNLLVHKAFRYQRRSPSLFEKNLNNLVDFALTAFGVDAPLFYLERVVERVKEVRAQELAKMVGTLDDKG